VRISFLLSAALGIIIVAASILFWIVLDLTGGFDQLNMAVAGMVGPATGAPFDVRQYLSLTQVATAATIGAVVIVALVTALAALGAVLYNVSATLVGGLCLTFTDAQHTRARFRQ